MSSSSPVSQSSSEEGSSITSSISSLTMSSSSGTHSGTHSGTSSSQADTIPVDNSDNSGSSLEGNISNTNVWGVLYPINCCLYKTMQMEDDEYVVGRDSSCQYQVCADHGFNKSDETKKLFSNISKKHFRIYRQKDDGVSLGYCVLLEDLSSNGTYINRQLVGNGHKFPIQNTARISLAGKDNEAFIFVDVFVSNLEQKALPADFRKKYCLERERLGSGANGVVRRGRMISSDLFVAVKMIEKRQYSGFSKDIYYEANLMCRIDHSNVVKIYDVFDSDQMLYIVLEYMKGGELFNYIATNGHLQESIARTKFKHLLNAVSYLHEQSIIHRDIKPENILLSSKDIHSCQFKITDFGLSRLVGEGSLMRTICGTPGYVAPEIIDGGESGYTGAVDMWSLGCVLYVMLSGSAPFSQKNTSDIKTGNFNFSKPIWAGISDHAKELIKAMLQVYPSDRISDNEAHKSKWFDEGTSTPAEGGLKRELSCEGSSSEITLKRKCGYN